MSQSITSLAKHSLLYGMSNGVNKLLPVIALPILTYYLSPRDFGIIAVLSLVTNIYGAVFGLGLGVSAGIVYFKNEDQEERSRTIATSFGLLAISSFVLLVLCFFFGTHMSFIAFRDEQFASLMLLHAAGIAFQIMTQPFLWELQFGKQILSYAVLSIGGAAITFVAILALVVWSGHGIRGWVEGVVIGNFAVLIFILLKKIRQRQLFRRLDLAPELLRLGFPHIPAFGFVFLIQYSGIYVLEWFVPLDRVGIYGIGYNVGTGIALATAAFSTAWYPFFQDYGKRSDGAIAAFQKILLGYTLVFGSLCLLFFIFAKPFVSILLHPRYLEAYTVIGPVALAQFFLGMWVILLPGVYFSSETYYMPVIQFLVAIIVVGLNLLLIPILSIQGAAISLVLGTLSMVFLQGSLNKIRRYLVVSYVWYRPGLLVGLLLLMGIGKLYVDSFLSPAGQLIIGFAAMGIYIFVAWSILTADEKTLVLQWAKAKPLRVES